MKFKAVLIFAAVLGLTPPLSAKADDLFQMFWRGTVWRTNSTTGHIIARKVSERDFVARVAQDSNLRPSDLVFVYRPNKRDTAVVRASTGAFVANVMQMEFAFTDVVNPRGTVIVRHAFLFDEDHDTAIGSFFGMETRTLNNAGNLLHDRLVGTALYAKPDEGTVFSANVSTGRRIVDRTNAP